MPYYLGMTANWSLADIASEVGAQLRDIELGAPEFHRIAQILDPYMVDHALAQYWKRHSCLLGARDILSALVPYEDHVFAIMSETANGTTLRLPAA